MAKPKQPPFEWKADDRDVLQLLQAVRGVDAQLRKDINGRIKAASAKTSDALVADLSAAAAGDPLARKLIPSIKTRKDRMPKVVIGGKGQFRRRRSPGDANRYGAILWLSERGNSGNPDKNGNTRATGRTRNAQGYWIAPTVERFLGTKAYADYYKAVVTILNDEGLL